MVLQFRIFNRTERWNANYCCLAKYWFAVGLAGCILGAGPSGAVGSELREPTALLIKLKSTGDEGISECAERSFKSHRSSSAAGSGASSRSLEEFHLHHRTRSVAALFRRPDGRPLREQRRTLEKRGQRLARRASAHARMGRRASRPSARPIISETGTKMAGLADIYRFELAPGADMDKAISALRDAHWVEWVQRDQDQSLDAEDGGARDPYLSSEGSWGQPYADLWGLHRIRAPEAWGISRGAGVIIAVVDTGLDAFHPDIAANVWVNPGEDLNANGRADPGDANGIDDDGNGFVDDLTGWNFVDFGRLLPDGSVYIGSPDSFDDVGHGTHVAGIAAAVGDNGIGIAGVAPESLIMSLKGFSANGSGREGDLWRAVLYAIENGARVVNASWSCSPHCPDNPLAKEVLELAEAAGVVFVTSAGNSETDVVSNSPENSRLAVTVGSIGFDDDISSFSNRGWLVDVVAPGGGPHTPFTVPVARRNILSLLSSGTDPIERSFWIDEDYYRLAGTSMAAPAVSGAVAVLFAQDPSLSVSEVRRRLRLSARDLGDPGHDPVFGPGALDVRSLLETPLPDLDLELVEPATGSFLDPSAGPIDIRVHASGSDLSSISIAVGRGLEDQSFVELERLETDDSSGIGVLRWDASDLVDGPVVVRLRARLFDGRSVDEYAVFAFERIQPSRISDGSGNELDPSVSGTTVAWRAAKVGPDGQDLVRVGRMGRRGKPDKTRPLLESNWNQTRPIVSNGRIVWLEQAPTGTGERLMSCRIGSRALWRKPTSRDCRPIAVATSDGRLEPYRFKSGRVLWSDRVGLLLDVMTCQFKDARRCPANRLPTPTPPKFSTRLLAFDGKTAVWTTGVVGSRVELCTIDRRASNCRPVHVPVPPLLLPVDAAAIDGTRLVLESFHFGGNVLSHCVVDLLTGDCELRPIESGVSSSAPVVSGARIAWVVERLEEPTSIAFCEVDPFDGQCRVQKVTGSFRPSRAPSMDGHRLVWEDDRFGPSQILATELPVLRAPPRVLLKAGRRRVVPIYSRDSAGDPLSLALEGVSGLPPGAAGARLEVGKGGAARIVFAPSKQVSGSGRWRLVGTSREGWTTQQAIEIKIWPAKGAKHSVGHLKSSASAAKIHESRYAH